MRGDRNEREERAGSYHAVIPGIDNTYFGVQRYLFFI
jgi:hypothetical protein